MKYSQELHDTFQNLHAQHFKSTPKALYQPVSYAMESGGKYIRPLLMIYASELFGGKKEDVLLNAYGIELFHNFTLVHDDIMDNAEVRRGKDTVFKKFGLNAGILSGDFMFISSLQLACRIQGKSDANLFDLVSDTAIKIHEGQQLDVDFESVEAVTEEEYIQMIEYKTAVLLACSLQMGAYIAGAKEADQKKMYAFGRLLGIAFQIQDDYLDAFGENAKVGKRIGGDILNNKKTLLFIASLAMSNAAQKEELLHWFGKRNEQEEEKIAAVKKIFEACGAKAYCERKMKDYLDESLLNLKSISSSSSKSDLLEIANLVIERKK